MEHTHKAKTSETRPFWGPVATGAQRNPAAHGGFTRREVCRCGAARKININGKHVEKGEWKEEVAYL